MIRNRAGKRRIATRFAVAGALAATPITVLAGTAYATTDATTHHDQFGELVALRAPADVAPGPEQVPLPAGRTYTLTLS